jgi:hypothetical protein
LVISCEAVEAAFAGGFFMAVSVWFWLAFVYGTPVATPNDPKLSDSEARRGSCDVERRRRPRAQDKARSEETGPS